MRRVCPQKKNELIPKNASIPQENLGAEGDLLEPQLFVACDHRRVRVDGVVEQPSDPGPDLEPAEREKG